MQTAAEELDVLMQSQFIEAIKGDDLSSLLDLAKKHGTEVCLSLMVEEHDKTGTVVQSRVYGTPLFIATYLKREGLAIGLVLKGARHQRGNIESTAQDGCNTQSLTPIEVATSLGLVRLTRALFEAPEPIDWSIKSSVETEAWQSSAEVNSLFYGLMMNPRLVSFLQAVGYFRGLVKGTLVVVNRGVGGFDVKVDGKSGRRCSSMREALLSIHNRLEVHEERDVEYSH